MTNYFDINDAIVTLYVGYIINIVITNDRRQHICTDDPFMQHLYVLSLHESQTNFPLPCVACPDTTWSVDSCAAGGADVDSNRKLHLSFKPMSRRSRQTSQLLCCSGTEPSGSMSLTMP